MTPALFPVLPAFVRAVAFDDVAPSAEPPTGTAADARAVAEARLAGVALRLQRDGRVGVDDAGLRLLREAAFSAADRAVEVLARSAGGLDGLRDAGIPYAVTKGPGIAGLSGGAAERPFTDLDVVVRPRDFRGAVAVLAALGYGERTETRTPWAWMERRCREAVNLRHPDGGSLDVHHHVPPWLWAGRLSCERLIAAAGDVCLAGGRRLPVASPAHNFLVAALHIVSDHNRPGANLTAWRDVALLGRLVPPDEVIAAADEAGLVGWVRWVLGHLPADARPPALWVALPPARLRHRRRLALLLPPRIGSRHMVGQALRLPAPNAVMYLGGMALPSRAFLDEHGYDRRYPQWWQRSLRRAATPAEGVVTW